MNAVIVLTGVFFFGMGIFALARPAALIRPFGITLPNPESRAEVRAVYGGFGLAIAAVLALAAIDATLRDGILITVAAALGGMAFFTEAGDAFERVHGRPSAAWARGRDAAGGLDAPGRARPTARRPRSKTRST